MASLSNELSQQTWENFLKIDDVNQDIFNKHCPVEKVPQKALRKNPGSPTV